MQLISIAVYLLNDPHTSLVPIIIVIIDNRGLNARWCLTPLLLSLLLHCYYLANWV